MRENGIRVGTVSSIDYERGMMQVVYPDKDNAVTARLPYANFNNEYCMPKIGERVLVAHLSNGSSRGVVLGSMWNKKNLPEENGKGIYRKELSKTRGEAYIRYDDGEGEYLIRANNAAMAAGEELKLENGRFSTTLSSILERLEALDGDTSARK